MSAVKTTCPQISLNGEPIRLKNVCGLGYIACGQLTRDVFKLRHPTTDNVLSSSECICQRVTI